MVSKSIGKTSLTCKECISLVRPGQWYAKNSEIEWLGTCDGLLVVTWLLVVIFGVLQERSSVVSFLLLAQNRILQTLNNTTVIINSINLVQQCPIIGIQIDGPFFSILHIFNLHRAFENYLGLIANYIKGRFISVPS